MASVRQSARRIIGHQRADGGQGDGPYEGPRDQDPGDFHEAALSRGSGRVPEGRATQTEAHGDEAQ